MAINKFEGKYRFLSNFWPVQVEFDGHTYSSVEAAYQAAKTIDPQERAHIALSLTAAEAKKRGKKATLRSNWETIKLDIMKDLIHRKFDNADLALKLLETGSEELIEGNWWGDTFWGVCKSKGENHLGKILMAEREAHLGSFSD